MSDLIAHRVNNLESRADRMEESLRRLSDGQVLLQRDFHEITAKLGAVVTKGDLDSAVNTVLRDALNAVPARYAVGMQRTSLTWQIMAVLVMAAGLLLTYLRLTHGL